MTEASRLYSQDYFTYLQNRGFLRRLIRKLYLRDILKYCRGRTIDFGCGIGELLSILPSGSTGFEVNEIAVGYCKRKGLDVRFYQPEEDNYNLQMLETGSYSSFTMNHVLEHLDNSNEVATKIFASCYRVGVTRIVITVPGIKGYKSDKTHRTFIDQNYLMRHKLLDNSYYRLKISRYFPVNSPRFSKYFTHNELRLVFDRIEDV